MGRDRASNARSYRTVHGRSLRTFGRWRLSFSCDAAWSRASRLLSLSVVRRLGAKPRAQASIGRGVQEYP
jgi:hypothetical protein